jgi:hypothetical protein
MKGCRFLLSLVVLAALAVPAPAGFFFNKHPKPNPATRVPELLQIVRTETNDHKRAAAALELRNFDPAAFPEIISALADLTLRDPNAAVRMEAIQSLAKLRPVSSQAGWALEQAVDKDASRRVRLLARTSLIQYHLSGYRSGKPPEAPGEPAAGATAKVPATPSGRGAGPRPLPVGPPVVTTEPPLLEPVPAGPAKAQDGPELIPRNN